MRRTQYTLRRLINSRAFASRRGSMLIMVIVILVLLALLGTAMISTSRIDRVSAGQHAINVQVELLLDSAKRLVSGGLVGDLFGGTVYKQNPAFGQYRSQDSVREDRYMASRTPEVVDHTLAPSAANPVYWPSITYPLLGSTAGPAVFEAPGQAPVSLTQPKSQYRFIPTTGAFAGNPTWPMMQAWWYDAGAGSFQLVGTFPAADTDGDGIADAGLFKLPVGELNGVSYYVAVRIIDHGSAINLSTAWKINDDAITVGTPNFQVPGDFFPTNVNLMAFLANAASPNTAAEQVIELNKYRLNDASANPAWNATPVVDGTAANRPDFVYISGYDAMWHQLGRKLNNPGYNTQTALYQALSDSDGSALAYPFGLYSAGFGASTAGTRLQLSLETNAPTAKFTGAGSEYAWYDKNFDLLRDYVTARQLINVRALSVTRNGVSDAAPVFELTPTLGADATSGYLGTGVDQIPFYNRAANEIVPRASVNTAPFNYLWRAFYNVMTLGPGVAPYTEVGPNPGPTVDGRMFRSVLRDPNTTPQNPSMTSFEVMMLRAAIASVNTLDLRDSDYHVTSRKVVIRDSTNVANAKMEAMVYGAEPQPFITEVFVNTDNVTAGAGGANPRGYVAIELHNPYDVAISLSNWQLGILTRQNNTVAPAPANPYPNMRFKALTGFTGFPAVGAAYPAAHIIPPGGHVVLENFTNGAAPLNPGDALSRPEEAGTPTNFLYVPGLHEVLTDAAASPANDGTELVLLRPRRALPRGSAPVVIENDQPSRNTTANDPQGVFDEGTIAAPNLYDMVPVDSFDFAGLTNPVPGGPVFTVMHYVRPNGTGQAWKHLYPGRYTPSNASARHDGTQVVTWDVTAPDPVPPALPPPYNYNPWDPTPVAGKTPVPPTPGISLGNADAAGSYPNNFAGIQWANTDHAGPRQNTDASVTANRFPFGGFARDGDILQIPFIGAYTLRVTDTAGAVADRTIVLEVNSVSMDSQLAEDGDGSDNAYENLGRFTPLSAALPGSTLPFYDWASDLFDFLTVATPSDDYMPAVDPGVTQAITLADGTAIPVQRRYPPAVATPSAAPEPVKNSTTATAYNNLAPVTPNPEALLTTQGKININTASYYVLAQLPWVPNTAVNTPRDAISITSAGAITNVANGVPDNMDIARLIVAYRDGHQLGYGVGAGPFRTIFDLNKIIAPLDPTLTFQNAFGGPFPAEPDDNDGDLSPLGAGTDGVRNDFEEQFLMLNRVSNLITTRSDVFTCYLTLMGFRNANGPGAPELAVQRSAVMILDRSAVTGSGDTPQTLNVPTE